MAYERRTALRESAKCSKKKSLFPGFKPKDLLFLASFASLRENVLAVDLIGRTNSSPGRAKILTEEAAFHVTQTTANTHSQRPDRPQPPVSQEGRTQ
jgi:hypothetical protein